MSRASQERLETALESYPATNEPHERDRPRRAEAHPGTRSELRLAALQRAATDGVGRTGVLIEPDCAGERASRGVEPRLELVRLHVARRVVGRALGGLLVIVRALQLRSSDVIVRYGWRERRQVFRAHLGCSLEP